MVLAKIAKPQTESGLTAATRTKDDFASALTQHSSESRALPETDAADQYSLRQVQWSGQGHSMA
jgi:hypothetical protein